MRIHGFIQDSNYIIYALAEAEGKKEKSMIWSQSGRSYIKTGSRRTGDLQRHAFTEAQEAALNAFLDSTATITTYDIAL